MKKIFNNKFLKLICGAGNENLKEIEALAFVYASAGFNMIDIAAKNDVIEAAKNGLKLANKENYVEICVSVGLQNDIHLTKAIINKQKCINCGTCIKECPQNAIFEEDERILINEKNCIGCGRCIQVCKNEAILTEHKYKTPREMLLSVLSDDIDCVEFHCSSDDLALITESWAQIKSIFKGRLGFCLDRSKIGNDKLIPLIKQMADSEDIIIQADGKPMSGDNDDYKSNLQTISFAEIIRNNNITNPLILSGGTNSKTAEFTKLCNININGIAIGSYARKLIKDEISNTDFFENKSIQLQAIEKAKLLAEKLVF